MKTKAALAIGGGIVGSVIAVAALNVNPSPAYSIHFRNALFDADIPRGSHSYLEREWALQLCEQGNVDGIVLPDRLSSLSTDQASAAMQAAEKYICPNLLKQ